MPIRFGVSFPAWFNPNYKPTKPIEPEQPEKEYYEKYSEPISEFFFDGMLVDDIITNLSRYSKHNNEDNVFFIKSERESFITVFEEKKRLIVLNEKEYEKKVKEYEKKVKEYEKSYNEYLSRLKKFDSLLIQHESAKYTSLLAECEDSFDDIENKEYMNNISKIELLNKMKDYKENIEKINEQKHKIIP